MKNPTTTREKKIKRLFAEMTVSSLLLLLLLPLLLSLFPPPSCCIMFQQMQATDKKKERQQQQQQQQQQHSGNGALHKICKVALYGSSGLSNKVLLFLANASTPSPQKRNCHYFRAVILPLILYIKNHKKISHRRKNCFLVLILPTKVDILSCIVLYIWCTI